MHDVVGKSRDAVSLNGSNISRRAVTGTCLEDATSKNGQVRSAFGSQKA